MIYLLFIKHESLSDIAIEEYLSFIAARTRFYELYCLGLRDITFSIDQRTNN